MSVSQWTDADTRQAKAIWSEYQRLHDLSSSIGRTAGVEPASGRVWIGDSIQDVIAQRDAENSEAPLFFVRIGAPAYYQKGGRT